MVAPLSSRTAEILSSLDAGTTFAHSPSQAMLGPPILFAVAAGGSGTAECVAGGESVFIDPPNAAGWGMFAGGGYDQTVAARGHVEASHGLAHDCAGGDPAADHAWQCSSRAAVDFKTFDLSASHAGTSTDCFATAAAQAGFSDRVQLSAPGHGGPGVMRFALDVQGALSIHQFAQPGLWVTPYLNHGLVERDAAFAAANPLPVSGRADRARHQTRQWWLSDDPAPGGRLVRERILFSVPFLFGQPFTLGLFAVALAGRRRAEAAQRRVSSSGSEGVLRLQWGGIVAVQAQGRPVDDFRVASASGTDWVAPAAPKVAPLGRRLVRGVPGGWAWIERRWRRSA